MVFGGMICSLAQWWPFFLFVFFRTLLSLAFFSSFATFPNFFSVWLSRMCPWREQPTTDAAAEILPVKVFLIINVGPPYWHNSRLPVDSHYISLTHCHELFSHSHTRPYTGTCMQEQRESHSRHMEVHALAGLRKYDHCICIKKISWRSAQR